ncbi:unnamed protein product [Peniophora sp. CBMAI 1063]|nr:unnamed protein product [Peniophora sp. CBMAI 1063]
MDPTKKRLSAFFDTNDEESPASKNVVDSDKMNVFAHGTVKKSKREKEKEAEEKKQREEEEYAKKAYAEFVEAFEGEDTDRSRPRNAFVRSSKEEGRTYAPSAPRAQASRTMRAFEKSRSPSPVGPARPKGKRAMDAFLEEIKREQADREARFARGSGGRERSSATSMAAYEGQSGSKDRGDAETSNVFVSNLPSSVTEQSLGMYFARAGPVGSVKIMWPRTDGTQGPGADLTSSRRAKGAGLSGFVSFMKRKGAEKALQDFDGCEWEGSVLRVGWSKAVPVAPYAKYSLERAPGSSHIGGPGRSPSHSPSPPRRSSRRSRSPPHRARGHSRSRSPRGYRSDSRSRHDRRDRSPLTDDDETSAGYIRTVASEVRGHGDKYEESLREREKTNSRYGFLTDSRHRKHRFYKSLLDRERGIEPDFVDEGYNSIYSTDSAEESEREHMRRSKLGRLARRRFEAMLRALTGTREEIARCMAFSLEHAEAANEVADIIIASLVVDGTPVPRKIARLYLICDILHNSAAPLPMAWKFRQEFQSRLGLVFDHLSTIYHSFPGRITAQTFKAQVTSVVDIWDDWIVFPPDFTAELRQRLEGQEIALEQTEEPAVSEAEVPVPVVSRFKTSAFKPAEDMAAETPVASAASAPVENDDDGEAMELDSEADGEPLPDDLDGAPLNEVDGEPMSSAAVDVDGEPLALDGEPLDFDAEPMDDLDGTPFNDVDGAPMEDVDGEPMGDLDGEPMS